MPLSNCQPITLLNLKSWYKISQSDYLIQVDTYSHTEWQTVQIQISWLWRSQLIWIYTVCKGRAYPGSAGQRLTVCNLRVHCHTHTIIKNIITQEKFSWKFIAVILILNRLCNYKSLSIQVGNKTSVQTVVWDYCLQSSLHLFHTIFFIKNKYITKFGNVTLEY